MTRVNDWKQRQYAGKLTKGDAGQSVILYGWVDTIRDHGHLLFIHVRDVSGVVQAVVDPDQKTVYETAQRLRSEFVVRVSGTVSERSDETKNPRLPTGDIEVVAQDIHIITQSETPPFMVTEKELSEDDEEGFNVDEDIRLRYRYLDLRRVSMQQNIIKRSKILKVVRDYLDAQGFVDVETPALTKSTPEGARDYLVPSRTHPSKFYALPQSPQLFKQLLMVSGLDRYYQIVKCFRDEDLRPNRQPEFTQVDLEASFIDESYIYELLEGLIPKLFAVNNITVTAPFQRITYAEAIDQYGTDAPDLRFGMTFVDVTDVVKSADYQIFQRIIAGGGVIKGITLKGQADQLSKSVLQEELAKKVIQKLGGKGLTWMKVVDGKLQSNIVQFFSESVQAELMAAMSAQDGDVLFFVADTNPAVVNEVLGRFRVYIAQRQGVIDPDKVAACWVTDFPLFESKDGRLQSVHHPFTQPEGDIQSISSDADALQLNSRGYDLVINGEEVGGGSIRIHDPAVQRKIFELLGLSDSDIEEKFGFFVNALNYGTPPHGGLALGVDRLTAMILGQESIREVIAFPKNRVAVCPLTQAPSDVKAGQLQELFLKSTAPANVESPVSS